MFTTDQKSDLLFKKYLGKASSGTTPAYYSEPKEGRTSVYPTQIWSDYSLIPTSASVVSGVTSQSVDLSLIQVPGISFINSFYNDNLKDAIPFNFDPSGSYVPVLKKNDNTIIPVGLNDWFLDTEAGTVTFFGGLPSGVDSSNPPKVTFWRYIGTKGGLSGGSTTGSLYGTASWAYNAVTASYALTASYVKLTINDFISGQVEYPSVDNLYYLISKSPIENNITNMSIALASGTGTASLKLDNISIPGISNIPLSAMETDYTSSVFGGQPMATGSRLVLELSNMLIGAGRLYFTIGLTRIV